MLGISRAGLPFGYARKNGSRWLLL